MKKMHTLISVTILAAVFITGCKKDDPLSASDSSALYEDAAESIASAMGDESGGATESYSDILTVAGDGSFSTGMGKTDGSELITAGQPVYDSVSGWWNVTIDRSRSNLLVSSSVHREYQFQFLKNGVAQQFRITGNDTATTMKFKIINGSGYFSGPRVKHHLTAVHGAWTATDIDKDTVNINLDTTYVRAGVDSVITRNMIRTFDHTFTITNMINVRGLKFHPLRNSIRNNFYQGISGTVEGTYSAKITFQRGEAYRERNISTTFSVTLSGGEGIISMKGDGRGFRCGIGDGQGKWK